MIGRVLLDVTFLAYRGVFLLDAVIRTLVRLFWTRRKLLEWETAASTELRLKGGLIQFVAGMWVAPAVAIAMVAAVILVRPAALAAAAPFLIAWLLSPAVAFRVSQPRRMAQISLSDDDRRALRRIARKTWLFFEVFVGDDDHWLAPDNFQEIPDGRIAHRTSPTNSGLLLLSTLAAHDLGYITLSTLIDRIERTFETLDKLEKHWGHFYNWYHTRTLQPLPPRYVSPVDSGNFRRLSDRAQAGTFGEVRKARGRPGGDRGAGRHRLFGRRANGQRLSAIEIAPRQEPAATSANGIDGFKNSKLPRANWSGGPDPNDAAPTATKGGAVAWAIVWSSRSGVAGGGRPSRCRIWNERVFQPAASACRQCRGLRGGDGFPAAVQA